MTSGTQTDFRFRDIALVAYGPSIVSAIGHGAILPVLALRARDLGADVSTAAAIIALTGVGMLLASLPSGAIVARIGERRTLVAAGFLDAGAMALAALTDSVAALAVAVLLSGVCWTAFLIARQGFMIDIVPATHTARAMSLLGGSYRVGVLIGPLIGAGMIALTDLTSVFWLGAAMSVCASLLAATMPDLGSEKRAAARESGHLGVWSVIHAHRRVLATLGVAVVILGASRSLRLSLLPLWADHIGLSASTTSLIFAGAAALDVLFMWPGGWLMDTRGRMVVAVPVVASMAIACLLLPLADSAQSRCPGDGDHRDRQRTGLGHRDDPGRGCRAGGRATPVPRRLATVRRHRQHGRPAARQRGRRRRAPRDGLPRRGAAGPGRHRLGGLLDPAGRPQPTVTVISLESFWVSVSITRNLLGPTRLVCT